MAEPVKDETPPTGEPSKEEPATPPPPAEEKAKEEGEKVPAWGQTLIDQVQGISEALTQVVSPALEGEEPPKPDDSPQPKPWHKRNPLKG